MLFMGKSTMSTGPFSIVFCMFTRGYIVGEMMFVKHGDLDIKHGLSGWW